MKKLIFTILLLLVGLFSLGQSKMPILSVQHDTDKFQTYVPNGQIVYCKDSISLYQLTEAGTPSMRLSTTTHINITNGVLANGGWSLSGNANTIDGTNFIGTTDHKALNFKIWNNQAGRLDLLGNVAYGGLALSKYTSDTGHVTNVVIDNPGVEYTSGGTTITIDDPVSGVTATAALTIAPIQGENQDIKPDADNIPDGGTYTLTFMGETTTPITYGASTAVIVPALEALTTIGAGNIAFVGASLTNVNGYQIRFIGTLINKDVDMLIGDWGSLTKGGNPLARDPSITETQKGGNGEILAAPIILPGSGYNGQETAKILGDGSNATAHLEFNIGTGTLNIAIGGMSLTNNMTGSNNVGIGNYALQNLTDECGWFQLTCYGFKDWNKDTTQAVLVWHESDDGDITKHRIHMNGNLDAYNGFAHIGNNNVFPSLFDKFSGGSMNMGRYNMSYGFNSSIYDTTFSIYVLDTATITVGTFFVANKSNLSMGATGEDIFPFGNISFSSMTLDTGSVITIVSDISGSGDATQYQQRYGSLSIFNNTYNYKHNFLTGVITTDSLNTLEFATVLHENEVWSAPTCKGGYGTVTAIHSNIDIELATFKVTEDGTVTLLTNSTNWSTSDTGGKDCIFDAGDHFNIKPRNGDIKLTVEFHYYN